MEKLYFCSLTLAVGSLFAGSANAQLVGVVTEDGLISSSSSALGTNDAGGGMLDILKPDAGATVRSAYLAAATFGALIGPGEVTLAGTPINFTNHVSNGFFENYFTEVTAIVAPIVDPAGAGLVQVAVTEGPSNTGIDGTVLIVIFDDPSVTSSSGVIILFGGQQTAGDQFTISLAAPLDLTDPGATAIMGLGISFGFQGPMGTGMVSLIDVNGVRLTSSAGGEDDGGPFNGGLITMGGIGDDIANPPDPFAGASSFDYDDELYNLLPFVLTGDMQIIVDTINPTNDDNIFVGIFETSVPISVADETLFLDPLSADVPLGCEHTVTATVTDAFTNMPIAGRLVNFNITSGPNAGGSSNGLTDSNGELTYSYIGDGGGGTDSIVADMLDSDAVPVVSNTSFANWDAGIGQRYCSPNLVNSSGMAATIVVSGSLVAADDELSLRVCGVPNGETGYFIWSVNPGFVDLVSLGVSDGFLCLGSGKGRFCGCNGHQGMVLSHFKNSAELLDIDTTNMPQSTAPGNLAIFAGLTGSFQYWFRDSGGTNGNNFSDAVSLQWQ